LTLILGLLGMYFDAVVVEVKTFLLLFRLALAILCIRIFTGITKSLEIIVNSRFYICFLLHVSMQYVTFG
jgi:hypothetical protein